MTGELGEASIAQSLALVALYGLQKMDYYVLSLPRRTILDSDQKVVSLSDFKMYTIILYLDRFVYLPRVGTSIQNILR